MANGGTFQGVKVLGEKGWKALHAKPTLGKLGFGSDDELHFTQVLSVFNTCKFVQYFVRAGSAGLNFVSLHRLGRRCSISI